MADEVKCNLCGNEATLKNVRGYIFPYKGKLMIELKVDFEAMACSSCEEILLNAKRAEELNTALELSLPKDIKIIDYDNKPKWTSLLVKKNKRNNNSYDTFARNVKQ